MKTPSVREDIRAFHARHILVDLHVDVIIQQRLFGYDIRRSHEPWFRHQPLFRHADIPRMLEGGYTFAALGIHYFPWESKAGWREVRRQLDYMEKVASVDERVVIVDTVSDIRRAKEEGKLAVMAGLEGAHLLAGQIEHIEEAKRRNCIYMTMAHFSKNSAATPSMGRGANEEDGLTPFGKQLVGALNKAKMIVDAAHVNHPCVLDICETSSLPVIASHTCCRGLYRTPRGLEDDGIRAIAETGGVMGIIFSPGFLTGKLRASLDQVVKQALYIAEMVGPQHVAIGSDFDGWIPSIPDEMFDCRDMPLLTQMLLDAGMSEEEVKGILGENFLRVMQEVRG